MRSTGERLFFRGAIFVCALLLVAHVVARAYVSATTSIELPAFAPSAELFGPAGVLVAVVVIVAGAIFALRIGPAERLFTRYNIKWAKPYLAVGLGAFLGAASTWFTDLCLWGSALSGMVAGLAAVGLHQILTIHDGGKS